MELKDIKSVDDIERYIEGCINDYDAGLSSKDETVEVIGNLLVWSVENLKPILKS